ncbi:unnamed protein product [Amoebophrya sp. A120]|nr:unnamed protein product [Amoebophrya sp. A120]|eukprot:GSA120T00015925001.1
MGENGAARGPAGASGARGRRVTASKACAARLSPAPSLFPLPAVSPVGGFARGVERAPLAGAPARIVALAGLPALCRRAGCLHADSLRSRALFPRLWQPPGRRPVRVWATSSVALLCARPGPAWRARAKPYGALVNQDEKQDARRPPTPSCLQPRRMCSRLPALCVRRAPSPRGGSDMNSIV